MAALQLFVPALNQFHNRVMYLLGRIRLGKEFPDGFHRDRDTIQIAFLFLGHNGAHHVDGQLSLLTEPLEALRLRKRRRLLFAFHCIKKLRLLLLFEIRQLNSRIEGDLLVIDHIQ